MAAAGQTPGKSPGGERKGAPMEGVDGNWRCSGCSNVNWAQRDKCHRCGLAKSASQAGGAPGAPVQQFMDAATGQVYSLGMDGQLQPAPNMMGNDPMAQQAAAFGGAVIPAPGNEMQELRQRQSQLEAQLANLQATLQPQVLSLSTALQQMQSLVSQMQAQMLTTAVGGSGFNALDNGSKRKSDHFDDPEAKRQFHLDAAA
jgi:hypothetical protein